MYFNLLNITAYLSLRDKFYNTYSRTSLAVRPVDFNGLLASLNGTQCEKRLHYQALSPNAFRKWPAKSSQSSTLPQPVKKPKECRSNYLWKSPWRVEVNLFSFYISCTDNSWSLLRTAHRLLVSEPTFALQAYPSQDNKRFEESIIILEFVGFHQWIVWSMLFSWSKLWIYGKIA